MKQLLCGAHLNGDNWYNALPIAEMAINNAPFPNSTYSAYYPNYGFHPCCEADVFNFCHHGNDQLEPTDDFISRMHSNWKVAYHIMEEIRETSREAWNKHSHDHDIHVGDRLLISLRKHDAATLSALPR